MQEGLDPLLTAAAEGDAHAWRKLVETYAGRVFGLLYRRCGDAELAEELTQMTFVKVVTKLGDYQESGRFEAWLFRIAINGLRDEMRRRKRQAHSMDFSALPPEALGYGQHDKAPGPDQAMAQQERFATLRQAVARLSDADRELIELRYIAELSFSQIAEALDQPLGTVLARGHRALRKLREMLDRQDVEE